ncbi:MAG: corrinoid protein [Desulfarculaceae bacterium]|jgi:5-methyltetrahydrofolate--homocysteine methyltransferase
MSALDDLKQTIISGDISGVNHGIDQAINQGSSALDIFDSAVLPAIQDVGDLWNDGRYFISDVVMSGEAFNEATAKLRTLMSKKQPDTDGKFVIGTVEGDIHDLGKNIVVSMMEGARFEVIDLGVNVPTDTFIQKVAELEPDILGLGAYMSTTMLAIGDVIQALESKGLRAKLKVMVGGIPVTAKFAAEVGADAYCEDALKAVAKAREMLQEKSHGA